MDSWTLEDRAIGSDVNDSRTPIGEIIDESHPIADALFQKETAQPPEIIEVFVAPDGFAAADAPATIDLAIADGAGVAGDAEVDAAHSPDLADGLAPETSGDISDDGGQPWSCPYGPGVCIGMTYYWCDAENQAVHSTQCALVSGCFAATCIHESGCVVLPTVGNSCDDDNPCTLDDHCADGVCQPGEPLNCDDANPCTDDSCDPETGGCVYLPATGSCGLGMVCLDAQCIPSYPAPPHGPFTGDIMANHSFLDPDDLSERSMQELYGDGTALLITFNAGWCKVCKEDTVLLNDWLAQHYDAGLRVLSILYESPNGTPVNQSYAQWWDEYYELTFPLWMDTPTAGANGKAEGGVLATYRKPSGPVPTGYFPVTLVVCPATMEILYIDKGFYDEIVQEVVEHWLYLEDCSG